MGGGGAEGGEGGAGADPQPAVLVRLCGVLLFAFVYCKMSQEVLMSVKKNAPDIGRGGGSARGRCPQRWLVSDCQRGLVSDVL